MSLPCHRFANWLDLTLLSASCLELTLCLRTAPESQAVNEIDFNKIELKTPKFPKSWLWSFVMMGPEVRVLSPAPTLIVFETTALFSERQSWAFWGYPDLIRNSDTKFGVSFVSL